MSGLRVSENRRYLVNADGTPFWWQGDTAWELFHRLTLDEAERYLSDRAAKGFTVIQAVALAELDGLRTPNPSGNLPLHGDDPTRPNEDYFRDVDRVFDVAAELGLVVGLLPTWGDKINLKWGKGPVVFTAANARWYGRWLAERYRDRPVVWLSGGDRPVENDEHRAVYQALAEGLREGDGGANLITYHPSGGESSSRWWHEADWLDFNLLQSGHGRKFNPNGKMVAADYARTPVKPCLDGEPCYENHPVGFKPENGWFGAWDVRLACYWALFSGAFGHTYGCHDIWQFWQPGRQPVSAARTDWRQSLSFPGAGQIRFAGELLLSRPFLTRLPDQELLAGPAGEGASWQRATRDEAGSYAMAYSGNGSPLTLDTDRLSGERLRAWWFDPRQGAATALGRVARGGVQTFTPPTRGDDCDWILVLDDEAAGYGAPGRSGWERKP